MAGLAKEREEIFLPDRGDPLVLPPASPALRLLQAVRDESHRFATTFHKKLRDRKVQGSLLEGLPGIGPKRSRALLVHFGSLERIAAAPPRRWRRWCGCRRPGAGAAGAAARSGLRRPRSASLRAPGGRPPRTTT